MHQDEVLDQYRKIAIDILSSDAHSSITLYSPYSDVIVVGSDILIQKINADKFRLSLPRELKVGRIKDFETLKYQYFKNKNYRKRFENG